MKLVLPLPEKISTNTIYAGKHWRTRARHKERYLADTVEWKNLTPITEYPVEITYIFRFKGRLLDTTNVAYMAKVVEDCLVAHGVLSNDSPQYVGATHLYSEKGARDEVEIYVV